MKRVLADTSVWIDHVRKGSELLIALLAQNRVLVHSAVIGELACGNLPKRVQFLSDLLLLPNATEASPQDVVTLIESRRLFGKGIGWIDAQLLASALLTESEIWTLDRKLADHANRLGIAFTR